MIQFNTIPPATLRVPLFYAEINGAQTPYVSPSRLLLLCQMNGGGSATPGEAIHVQGDPRDLFGINSMAVDMVAKARLNAPFQEIWALPIADNGSGAAATGKVTLPRALTAVAATTGNIANLATGAPGTVDGVSLTNADLVLVWQQDDPSENGLYSVTSAGTGANGQWARATAMDVAAEAEIGCVVTTGAGGSLYPSTKFRLSRATTGFTFDTDPINFTQTGVVVVSTTISLWIGEVQIQSVAYSTDTGVTLAARLVSAINAKEGCPLTAAVNGSVANQIDLTARHKGTIGNTVWIDTDYYGSEGGVAATIFAITQMSGGTGDPDFSSALAGLADEPFDWIVGPYTDPTHMAVVETFLNPVSGRWSPYQQLYGHYVGVKHANVSDLMTYGSQRNSPTTSVFGIYRAASPSWCWAGALGGRIAAHLSEPPELSRPLQSLDLIGILPPKVMANRPNITDRNSLYWSGISSYHVDGKTKTCSIDRIVTNYRVNEWGSPDASWLDIETRAQVMYSIRAFKAAITGAFPRAALVDENPDNLQGFASPDDIKKVIVHEYKRQASLGVVEDPALFSDSVIVERSTQDANRVDVYLPADLVNQLRIVAVNYTAFLQRERMAVAA